MEALRASSLSSFHLTKLSTRHCSTQFEKTNLNYPPSRRPNSALSSFHRNKPQFKLFNAISSPFLTESIDPPEKETEIQNPEEQFDWFAHWYPIMPVCDLDKRKPHGKKVIGLDVVVWWDRNESEWKVFDDSCPHRLAPLSEGRIDQWGRLQCVYHGWCFGGTGDCKFIPQAPRDGPPVTSCMFLMLDGYKNNRATEFWLHMTAAFSVYLCQNPVDCLFIYKLQHKQYGMHLMNMKL
ncbi:unnamed protein product [Ilex paraguariensis]|uniref:Rieske domain-containing protein n=1 Tax=Ilex paraguariensis TaxID=185542 RepID=A0ABC8SXS2_9AQUA